MLHDPQLKISEKAVVGRWRRQMLDQTLVEDVNGEILRVVYPGRPNDGRGGDFRDAVIISPEGLLRGCIEVHTLTSGWQSHGHHLDPHYNQVVLQVAWKADHGIPARSQNGRIIPTVLLQASQPDGTARPPTSAGLACRASASRLGSVSMAEILERAGEQRFCLKSRSFQSDLESLPAAQVLYQGLAAALGYAPNQIAFLNLARRIPLSTLESQIGPPVGADLDQIQSFLLGRAGLLPSQRGLDFSGQVYIARLETIWKETGWTALSPRPAWEFYRVRPGNHPVRRLMAMSYWLWKGRFEGWEENYLSPLIEKSGSLSIQSLAANLKVEGLEYWSRHCDFGSPAGNQDSVLIGDARAAEMIINVILPFLLAWATVRTNPELIIRALSVYRAHRPLAANSIQRHMSGQLGLPAAMLSSACRQQGLIHIYKTCCTQGRCADCPLA